MLLALGVIGTGQLPGLSSPNDSRCIAVAVAIHTECAARPASASHGDIGLANKFSRLVTFCKLLMSNGLPCVLA